MALSTGCLVTGDSSPSLPVWTRTGYTSIRLSFTTAEWGIGGYVYGRDWPRRLTWRPGAVFNFANTVPRPPRVASISVGFPGPPLRVLLPRFPNSFYLIILSRQSQMFDMLAALQKLYARPTAINCDWGLGGGCNKLLSGVKSCHSCLSNPLLEKQSRVSQPFFPQELFWLPAMYV